LRSRSTVLFMLGIEPVIPKRTHVNRSGWVGVNEGGGAMQATPHRSDGALHGKVAIVVGASRGIGAAAGRALARAGATVVLASRSESQLKELADDIASARGLADPIPADVTRPDSIEELVRQTIEHHGRLDAAFNNAGEGALQGPLADVDPSAFDRVLDVNLRGTFVCMRHQIPAMLASGGGSIVNMASTAGVNGWQGLGAYVAAKHGVVGLTRSAALDYAAQGIRINAVAPGPILNDRISALSDEQREPIAAAVPLDRIGTPDEVAEVVAWLCSEASSFVTGAVVPVDGGQLARI
jgi:NAD(P)-dependent dehydrogenase (short-subunit alcohol dehydrogenase family)